MKPLESSHKPVRKARRAGEGRGIFASRPGFGAEEFEVEERGPLRKRNRQQGRGAAWVLSPPPTPPLGNLSPFLQAIGQYLPLNFGCVRCARRIHPVDRKSV